MSEHAKMITAGIKAEPGADVTKAPWSPEADLLGKRDAAPTHCPICHCYPLAHQLKGGCWAPAAFHRRYDQAAEDHEAKLKTDGHTDGVSKDAVHGHGLRVGKL